ncbi:MAG: 2-keto-4-pentenoate hydratase [Chromatiales bacterium]|jgi:2-keto-4-pentenoate hydratase|nr:2-keto-4-pentenoate hydratase [Chromatiales bacterium]
MADVTHLIAWLDEALTKPELVPDIRERHPSMTAHEAYQLQAGVMDARVARGDKVFGYKAALTSAAMQAQIGIGQPLLGTLLQSRLFTDGATVSLSEHGFMRATLEPEIAVVLSRDLSGPSLRTSDVHSAIAGYLPAIELGDYRTEEAVGRTLVGSVVCNTFNGGTVLGRTMTPPSLGLDLCLEGMTMKLNGEPVGSGTGIEVLGDPLNSVAFMANELGKLGRGLKAGMVLMTGSIVASVALSPGDHVQVGFTRLGTVEVRIVE